MLYSRVLVESRHRLLSRDAIIAQQVLRPPPPAPLHPTLSPKLRNQVHPPRPHPHSKPGPIYPALIQVETRPIHPTLTQSRNQAHNEIFTPGPAPPSPPPLTPPSLSPSLRKLTPHLRPRQDLVQTTLGKALGMIYCRKALGEGDHVHLAGLGSLFLVIMAAQAVIIGLGWSPETTLRRCRRSTPAATELEEREQGSQPAKSGSGWSGGWAHVRRARALPRAIGLLQRPRARG